MGITVNSPFTGRPVKIMEKDVGKAVTDEDGGIFYVLPKADGSGYYGAPTRHGGEKDELRAADHDARSRTVQGGGVRSGRSTRPPATGSRGKGAIGFFVVLIILGIAAWAVVFGPLRSLLSGLGAGE